MQALRTRMYDWVTSGTMSRKGQLKKLDMTHLERKYLKIAKNCHRTVAAGAVCVAERGELGLRGSRRPLSGRLALPTDGPGCLVRMQ